MKKINYLKEMRIKAGLTQQQVADHFGYTSPQHISALDRGISSPSIKDLKDLAFIYKVDVETMKKKFLKAKVEAYENKLKRKLGL